MIKVSAPGKVHLVGEHAVVYGEPAILSAVGLRTYAKAEKCDRVIIDVPKRGFHEEYSVKDVLGFYEKVDALYEEGGKSLDFSKVFAACKGHEFKKAVIGLSLKKLDIEGGIYIKLRGDIPMGSGLGSSASVAVTIAKAIDRVYERNSPIEKINEIAYRAECYVHGNPSGGDNSACAYGGLIWFQKGDPNVIRPLKNEVPNKLKDFILVYIGKPEKTTGELVSMVRGLEESFREPRVKAIGQASRDMLEALKRRDFDKVKGLINLAWDNLSELGLSTPEADEVIKSIRNIGGAAKLCGACGGGIMLAYHENLETLSRMVTDFGYEPMEVELNVDGARIED